MFKINKLNIATGAKALVPFPTNALFEYLEDQGIDPKEAVMKVSHAFNKKACPEAQKALHNELHNGIEGYKVAFGGSSDIRKAQHVDMLSEYLPKFIEWASCGLNMRRNILPNKYAVYMGTSLSASTKWKEATILPEINIDNVAIVKDVEVNVEGVFDVVENGTVRRERRTVTNKITDGLAIGIVDDTNLACEEAREIVKNLNSFTFRGETGWKGLIIWVLKSRLIAFLDSRNYGYEIVDAFGNKRDIRELQLIAHVSVFKWFKALDNWEQYVNGFKKYKHEFRVCVKDHEGISDMPYQQFQTLLAIKEETDKLVERTVTHMSEYEDITKAHFLLPKAVGQVAKVYPALLKESYVAEELQKTWSSKRQALAGGRLPNMVHYRFAAPDIVAVLEGLFGKEVNGVIPAKRIICNKIAEGKIVDITRCPHLDNAHVLRQSFKTDAITKWLFTGTTVYFSCHDAAMNAMQMDFDGDHVAVCEDEMIVRLARDSIRKIGNVPLYYEAKSSKASTEVTDEQVIDLFENLNAAPVGLYANALTKVWAGADRSGLIAKENYAIALLTEGGNTCIDAAKNSAASAGDQDSATTSLLKCLRNVKKPMFMAYAKTSAQDPRNFADFAANCKIYDSCVDQYSQEIIRLLPAKLEIDGLEDLTFDWHVLTSGKACRKATEGLITPKGLRGTECEGLFNKLAYQKAKDASEINKLDGNDKLVLMNELNAETRENVRKQIFAWAAEHGYDNQTVLDSMIMMIHIQTDSMPKVTAQLKRVLWDSFGDEILANVRHNIETGTVPGAIDEAVEEDPMDDQFCYTDEEFDGSFIV